MSGQGRWKDEVKKASFDGLSDKKIGLLVGSFLTGSNGGVNNVGWCVGGVEEESLLGRAVPLIWVWWMCLGFDVRTVGFGG